MSHTSSCQVRWFALMLTLVLISVTYLLSESGKIQINAEALKLFGPLPAVMNSPDNVVTDAKVKLGRVLYYDPRLSASQKISCNTCHPLDAYGAESTRVSTGHKHQKGNRNAPTVYNAAGHFVQLWDGRAATVEEQAKGPITNPVEMAMPSHAAAVQVIASMPEYVALFQTAFPKDKDKGSDYLQQHGVGDWRVRARTGDSVGLGCLHRGRPVGSDGRRKIGLQHICRNRLPMVPLRSVCRWSVVPEARRCETVARPNRSGTLPGDQEGERQDGLQGPLAAEHQKDGIILS